jgi:hypothetical protein
VQGPLSDVLALFGCAPIGVGDANDGAPLLPKLAVYLSLHLWNPRTIPPLAYLL